MNEHECKCDKCVEMCTRFPCRPLPEEVVEMPAEVQARLSIQEEGDGLSSVPHLQPAVVGYEGQRAHDFDIWFTIGSPGRCTFLTEDGLCELHGKCKPFEGRTALHGQSGTAALDVLKEAWGSAKGREVLKTWREKHNEGL